MSNEPTPKPVDRYKAAAARARHALRLVCAEMPHLAGLAHLVRVVPTRYFSVAAVGPTGALCVNPNLFSDMPMADAAFVLAHELLHLALDTHTRQGDANPHLVNVAHDFIINDMLSAEMGRGVPLNGLVRMGARDESLESLVVDLSKQGGGKVGCWASGRRRGRRRPRPGKSPIREALENAGLVPPDSPPPEIADPLGAKNPLGDLLTPEQEQILEPHVTPERRRQLREEIRKAAAKALSLGALRARIDETQQPDALTEPQRGERLMKALHTAYQPPWQLALQRWLDAVAPSGRSYAKASRRGADRDDGVVLCGRLREGWALHIVLDTSGSMAGILPNILGVIASFCEGAGVAQAHILQCDIEVTRDEWLEPAQLSEYRIAGFGGSDMSPGLNRLAEDTEVAAVLVLTDGYITFPKEEPPYAVLWAVFRDPAGYAANFRPPYGAVTFLDP